jgi:hypothetical protein
MSRSWSEENTNYEDTPAELGKRLAIFGVSGVAGSMFLGILQAALYKNLNGAGGLEVSISYTAALFQMILTT